MIIIHQRLIEDQSIEGDVNGMIETKRISVVQENDEFSATLVPSLFKKSEDKPNKPYLLVEEFDYDNSTKDIKMLTPRDVIEINKEQEKFFEKHFGSENIESPLSNDFLENKAPGANLRQHNCPVCGSDNIYLDDAIHDVDFGMNCNNCGYRWDADNNKPI